MKGVECPYCEAEIDICHDDGYGMDESDVFNQECSACGKTFAYSVSFSINHTAWKAPCLNGEPHEFKHTQVSPKRFTRWRCANCGEENPLTEEEMRDFLDECLKRKTP